MPRRKKLQERMVIGKHLVLDPHICHGQLTFKGTRVLVRSVLKAFERGESWDNIRQAWPTVPPEAIQEALALATEKLVNSIETDAVREVA